MSRNYWGYRIDTKSISFFKDELMQGRLRQGWGWHEGQDLRDMKVDKGAQRNLAMFRKVKKGDLLLVPRLPSWGEVALVEATEDWSEGYRFEIPDSKGDYGHIFPVKYLKSFTRKSKKVSGNIRSTLRNPSRFWSINHYEDDVKQLLQAEQDDLKKSQDHISRMESIIGSVFTEAFNEEKFSDRLNEEMQKGFTSAEWEFILVEGLQKLFPFYTVERVGGKKEKEHGTDILIKLPSLLDEYQYAIAIQVKDYEGFVQDDVIRQINKADDHWHKENLKLIDKWIIITKAARDANPTLDQNNSGVQIIFAEELKELLNRIGLKITGETEVFS